MDSGLNSGFGVRFVRTNICLFVVNKVQERGGDSQGM